MAFRTSFLSLLGGIAATFYPATVSTGVATAGEVLGANAAGLVDASFMPIDGSTLGINGSGYVGAIEQVSPYLVFGSILPSATLPARTKLGMLGDSTTVGVYGDAATGQTNSDKTKSVSFFLAQQLNQKGILATNDSTFGSGNENLADPRVTMGGGFGVSGAASLGGPCFQCTSTGTFSFTAALPFTSVDVWMIDAAAATYTISVNGGASLGTESIPGTSGNAVNAGLAGTATTIYPAGSTVTLTWASGTMFLIGLACFNLAAPAVEIYNFGSGGAISGGYITGGGYNPIGALISIAPQTVIYEIGLNDANSNNVTPAQYSGNVQTTVNLLQAAGIGVVLAMPHPFAGAYDAEYFPGYLQALYALGKQYNCPVIDFYTRYQPVAQFVSSGLLSSSLHPEYAVYEDKAAVYIQRLFRATGMPTLNAPKQLNVGAGLQIPAIVPMANAAKILNSNAGATARTTVSMTANVQYMFPISVGAPTLLSKLGIGITTVGASSLIQIGIYADNGNLNNAGNLPTGSPLASVTGLSGATVATVFGTLATPLWLLPGVIYWVAVVCSVTTVVTGIPVAAISHALGYGYSGTVGMITGYDYTTTSGALLAPISGTVAKLAASSQPQILMQ